MNAYRDSEFRVTADDMNQAIDDAPKTPQIKRLQLSRKLKGALSFGGGKKQ
jgi:hypothetical protein